MRTYRLTGSRPETNPLQNANIRLQLLNAGGKSGHLILQRGIAQSDLFKVPARDDFLIRIQGLVDRVDAAQSTVLQRRNHLNKTHQPPCPTVRQQQGGKTQNGKDK